MMIGRREAALIEDAARQIFRREGGRPVRALYRPPLAIEPSVLGPGFSPVPRVAGLRLDVDERVPPDVVRVAGANFVADVRIGGQPLHVEPRTASASALPVALLRGLLAGQQ